MTSILEFSSIGNKLSLKHLSFIIEPTMDSPFTGVKPNKVSHNGVLHMIKEEGGVT